jgi:hypothetical protein
VVVLPGGWVRRQLCELLSALFQAAAHLPPTVSRLLLRLYLLHFTGGSCNTHLLQQALFRVLLGACSSFFLQCRVLPTCYSCIPCLFRVHMGNCPSPYSPAERPTCQPLLQAFPTPSSLGGATKCTFSSRFVYLQFVWGTALSLSPELKVPRPLCYVSFQFLVYYSVLFFFCGVRVSLSGGYAD